MHLATPPSRLRRGVRRLALTICALILGAGFTPALPSTMEPAAGPAVTFTAAAAPAPAAPRSTVDQQATEPPPAAARPPLPLDDAAAAPVPAGRPVGAVAG